MTSLIEDVLAGLDPGWYTSVHLYDLHKRQTEEPVSKKAFGTALKALGYHMSTRLVDGSLARSWMIAPPPKSGTVLKPISESTPVVSLTARNLDALMVEYPLETGRWHDISDLYAAFCFLAREDGLVPETRRQFGVALKALGYERKQHRGGDPATDDLADRPMVLQVLLTRSASPNAPRAVFDEGDSNLGYFGAQDIESMTWAPEGYEKPKPEPGPAPEAWEDDFI